MELKQENLGGGITCFTSKEHSFGTDAVLLADFASPLNKHKCCDLGTGCGIIPLLWCRNGVKNITAVEIQEKGFFQLKKAIEFNGLDGTVIPIHSDLKDLKGKIEFGTFDIITMNPPYTAKGAGLESKETAENTARHEIECTLIDICSVASKMLKFGGRLSMCIRPERLCELFNAMQAHSLEPKRMKLVSKCPGKAPWLVMVEGRRGGKSGMTVEPELFVYGDNGEYSKQMLGIYGC